MKKLKYLLFILPFLFCKNVFALDYDVTSSITSPVAPSVSGTYTGEELNGATSSWNVNTRYQGNLQRIRYNIPIPDNWEDGSCFSNNVEYKITMYMATSDWRNRFGSVYVGHGSSGTNFSNGHVFFVSMKQIYFTFKIPSGTNACYDSLYVNLSSTGSSVPFTGETNWNLSKIVITDPSISTGGGSSGGSSGSTNQDIINNNTQNTQNIINNQNDNTNNIISNNNNNTQEIINNQNQNNQSVINGIDSVNQQLGSCYKNLLKNIYSVNAFNNVYLGENDTYYQYQPDTYTTPRGLKLAFYAVNNQYISSSDYSPYLAVGRFNFSFTYTDNIDFIISGVNGSTLDTTFKIPLQDLDLEDNSVYTLSYSVTNATNGSVQFKNFSLVKGNYTSNDIIGYDKSICSSKIDDASSAIQGAVTGGVNGIINNQNSNTEKEIESQKVCNYYDKSNIGVDNRFLTSNGSESSFTSNWLITPYIDITNSQIEILKDFPNIAAFYCFYNDDKTLNSCKSLENLSLGILDIPNNSKYFRISIQKQYNLPQLKICKNGNQALNDSITDTNNYLKDDSEPIIDNSALNDVFGRVHFTDPLSYLLTLPTQLINKIVSMSDTCSPIDLGTLYGVHLTLPCINLENYLGTDLWNILDVILSVGLLSVILKNFYDTISNLLTLGGEKEAKEKFSMPTPMDFLAMILGGDRQ